jgi:NAD(P)-dependent dehydrogenase (short-subunit alcohol dehydrogenase family)
MPSIAVTGCSSGFGKATVHRFLERGWRVVATVRKDADRDVLVEDARANGAADRLTVVQADITQADDVARIGEAVAAHGAALDALVNNAGTAYPAPLELLPIDQLRAQLEVNVVAQLAVTQAVLPALKAARGIFSFSTTRHHSARTRRSGGIATPCSYRRV